MVQATNHHSALGPVSRVDAGRLNVGYADVGPANGQVAVLHGWPYDIHIGSQATGKLPLPPAAELQWAVPVQLRPRTRRVGYDKYRRDFAKLIWQIASPKWTFDDAIFDRSAASFDNPIRSRS